MKHTNQMPTFWLLLITTIILTVAALINDKFLSSKYHVDLKKEPLLTSIMQGFGDRVYPDILFKNKKVASNIEVPIIEITEVAFEENTSTEVVSEESESEAVNEVTSEPTTYSFETSDLHYFDDALFIGDSRTVGLHDYSNMKSSDFYAKVSSTIFEIMDDPMIKVSPNEQSYYGNNIISIRQALEKRRFGKIYIMIGINELGTGTADTYFDQFKSVIKDIQTLQPDAIIYIQSIMHVTTEKSVGNPIFNNTNIDARNEKIKTLADNHSIFYLNLNAELDDETHGLNPEYTFDSVHLKASKYILWENYLLNHTIVKQTPAN